MKKIFFAPIFILISFASFCQNIVGSWEGVLEIQGNKLPIVFHILKDTGQKYTASFDSPKQNSFNNPCSNIIVGTDSVVLMMKTIKGRYDGKLNESNTKLTGKWSQAGYTFPLDMKKVGETPVTKKINRPQTPHPPYPYKSEDVAYANLDKSIIFGATFTVPLPDPNVDYFRAPVYPTVILISGSGPQDRDETLFGHKPFAVIADYLTRQGIAVLRVDDRGVGETTGDFSKSTTADFAKDVEAGIDYLKSRADVDTNSIGIIGHSEGGLIAPMLASARKDIHFIVLLAGPGVPIIDLMEQQSADVMASAGISAADILQYRPLYKKIVTSIIKAKDSADAANQAIAIFKNWQAATPASTVINTTAVKNEKEMIAFINGFINAVSSPWFKYFLQIVPANYLAKTHCPVLALNGAKDIQVAAKQNLTAIKTILEKNKNKNVTTLERPGLNHLFQHCKTCTVAEYAQLEETFDIETLKIIGDWIKHGRIN